MSNIKLLQPSIGIATGVQRSASDLNESLQTPYERLPGRSPRSRKSKERTHA